MVLHRQTKFAAVKDPKQILALASADAKARSLVPLLLLAFVNMLKTHDGSRLGDPDSKEVTCFAPWTWATADAALAQAVANSLKQVGVREELCQVSLSTQEEEVVAMEAWRRYVARLVQKMGNDAESRDASATDVMISSILDKVGPVCCGCLKDRSELLNPLKKCGGCGDVWYCSRGCQLQHRAKHKIYCKSKSGASGGISGGESSTEGSSELDTGSYFTQIARTSSDAQELAEAMNITLPKGTSPSEDFHGLM